MIKKITIFILFTTFLFSDVSIKASKTFITNENMYFEIEASGSDIEFPKITTIAGLSVQNAGQSRSMSNINGRVTNKITRRFQLRPKEDFTIPSFTILIDGQKEKTKTLDIKKQIIKKTKSSYFDLDISIDNKNLYIGEQAVLTMSFKYKDGLQIINSSLFNVDFKDFWFKSSEASKSYKEGEYIVQKLKYILFPQKEGLLKIEPLRVDLSLVNPSSNEFFSFRREAKTVNIYSNSLAVNVKKLPENISLIGDFDISATINKDSIIEGEAISYKINIEGFGNIDDVSDIKLDIKDLTIYENKANITSEIKNDLYYGKYKKTFSILGKEDFIIPSITLSYFSKKLQKIIRKTSKSFNIKVKTKVETKFEKEAKLQKSIASPKVINAQNKKEIVEEATFLSKLSFFALGSLFAFLSMIFYLYLKKNNHKKEELPIIKKVKKTKDIKNLIKVLLPYLKKSKELDSLIFKVERSDIKDLPVLKKQIIEILKEVK